MVSGGVKVKPGFSRSQPSGKGRLPDVDILNVAVLAVYVIEADTAASKTYRRNLHRSSHRPPRAAPWNPAIRACRATRSATLSAAPTALKKP